MTGHLATVPIELVAVRLETDEEIYRQRGDVTFPGPLVTVRVHFRVKHIQFPAPGFYEFQVFVDGDLISQKRFRVDRESNPS